MAEDLNKRAGPFTIKQWVLGGVGGGAIFLGYRWYRNRAAGTAAAAQTALTGGTSIPAGSSPTGTAALPTTLAGWEQAVLAYGTDPIATLNAATNWMSNNCVDAGGYAGLKAAIAAIGLPPGLTSFPVLAVCSGSNPSGSGASVGAGNPGQNTPVTPVTPVTPGAPRTAASYIGDLADPTIVLPKSWVIAPGAATGGVLPANMTLGSGQAQGGAAVYGPTPNAAPGYFSAVDTNGPTAIAGFNYGAHPFVPVSQRTPGASYNSAGQLI